VLPEIWGLS